MIFMGERRMEGARKEERKEGVSVEKGGRTREERGKFINSTSKCIFGKMPAHEIILAHQYM